MAAYLYCRQREITDILVDLLIATVHRINARAEAKTKDQFISDIAKKVAGKENILFKIALASAEDPKGVVEEVVSSPRTPPPHPPHRKPATRHVMVLEDDSVLFVDGVEAARLLRISVRIGAKVPAYFTAGDRALLAELPSEQLDELYPRLPKGAPPGPAERWSPPSPRSRPSGSPWSTTTENPTPRSC